MLRATIVKRAVWLAMISMSSFFMALSYADLQRHGLTHDWFSRPLGAILSVNTVVLFTSSLALERSRRFLLAGGIGGALRWISTAWALGIAFLCGQGEAWRRLLCSGVFVRSYPDSGFFYLVTAAHAAHLLAGLGVMTYVFLRAWRGRLVADRPLAMEVTSIFWHMLDVTWLYIYLVLIFWH